MAVQKGRGRPSADVGALVAAELVLHDRHESHLAVEEIEYELVSAAPRTGHGNQVERGREREARAQRRAARASRVDRGLRVTTEVVVRELAEDRLVAPGDSAVGEAPDIGALQAVDLQDDRDGPRPRVV